MKETLVKAISNIVMVALGAGALVAIANGYRKDTSKQMEKLEPMLDECTAMMKKTNKYFDITMKQMEDIKE